MSQGPSNDTLVMNSAMVEMLLMHMCRCERVFLAAKDTVSSELFKADETVYRYIWEYTLDHYERYAVLPTQQVLSANVLGRMDTNAGLTPEMHETANDVVDWMYGADNPSDQHAPEPALVALRAFLLDRQLGRSVREAAASSQFGVSQGLPNLVAEWQENLRAIDGLQSYADAVPIPSSWDTGGQTKFPTGVTMIDTRLQGGSERGDVNVLLGTTGVGKTTLGMQIVLSSAKLTHRAVLDGTGTPELHLFFSYEDGKRSLQVRAMCFGAEIHKDRLEAMTTFNTLSTAGNLEEYEHRLRENNAAHGQPIPSEQQRLAEASEWINRYTRLVDFSGIRDGDDIPRGYGGIEEIRNHVDFYQQRFQMPIGVVAMDWAGMAVRRSIRTRKGDITREQTSELTDYVARFHDLVTAPFGARGWVLHQVTGQANKRSPTAELNHADAEQCASFAVNAWSAFVLGNKDERTNTCLLAATKTRRGPGRTSEIVLIDGAFGRLLPTDGNYTIDAGSNRIVLREENERLVSSHSPRQVTHTQRGSSYVDRELSE